MPSITPSLLRRIMPQAGTRADVFAGPLESARAQFVGDDPADVAMWLAQIAHESGSLRYVRELATGAAYEGRKDLGNVNPGDGIAFAGRGLLQLTGRANYRACGEALGTDLEANPGRLEQPQFAALSAGWFWQWAKCGALMDAADPVLAVTKRINGGTNGLAQRRAFYTAAVAALHDAQMDAPAELAPAPAAEPAQIEERSTPDPDSELNPERKPMIPAFVGALAQIAASMIPAFGKLVFDETKTIPERNLALAAKGMEVISSAVGAVNAQDAVEKIQADPAALKSAGAAIEANFFELAELGGGVDGARKQLVAMTTPTNPSNVWDQLRATAWSIHTALLSYIILLGGGWMVYKFATASADEKLLYMVAGAVLGYMAAVVQFSYGSSPSSRSKDKTISDLASGSSK